MPYYKNVKVDKEVRRLSKSLVATNSADAPSSTQEFY